MLCVSIRESSTEEFIRRIDEIEEDADLIELRVDDCPQIDFSACKAASDRPLVVACRPEYEGGGFRYSEEDRLDVLRRAVACGIEYVDIEYRTDVDDFERGNSQLIISYHDFDGAPEHPADLIKKMEARKPDIIKIAIRTNDFLDALNLAELARRSAIPTIAIPLGRLGTPVRILYRRFNMPFMYFSRSERREHQTGPGQISLPVAKYLYNVKSITDQTELYGVMGDPVGQSLGPMLFNLLFQNQAINAVYLPIVLADPDLIGAVLGRLQLRGASITMPLKEGVRRNVTTVSDAADSIGAMNTIARFDPDLIGHNTDWEGGRSALRHGMFLADQSSIRGKRALVVGAGGAARALIFALKEDGATVKVANRSRKRAQVLADRFEIDMVAWDDVCEEPCDILVNATPIGMEGREVDLPISDEALKKVSYIFDTVYRPRETSLGVRGRRLGCHVVTGGEMYVAQAMRQFALWFRSPVPKSVQYMWYELVCGSGRSWELMA